MNSPARAAEKYGWLARFPTAVLAGVGTGLLLRGTIETDFVGQIISTIQVTDLSTALVVVSVITTISYFYFTKEHIGILGVSSRIGRYVMMLAFGAGFASVATGRFASFFYAVGRIVTYIPRLLGLM